ncbi:MAG TPA: hypothetical protein VKA31_10765 [Mariprofundaceae bacterium]|nr:hypothetical protein [Mariprofundaceae bacterium]
MSNKTSNETAKQLIESVSFELDADLRLHPSRLELGKAELLTDALTLPFMDIEKRLAQYIAGASPAEAESLRKNMKNYLARLNSNPMIPLHFRLKVLNRFERELQLFDGEMTAAVLNAHKIGVDLVQKAARSQPAYYRVLVEMVTNAIDLAVKILRICMENYQAPAVIATRQVMDLSRLGLSVAPILKDDASSERDRFFKAVANFELLRTLDFYGKSLADQKMAWEELQNHTGILKPQFCRKGDKPPIVLDTSLLVTNMSRPNDPAKVLGKLPNPLEYDCIVIPMDAFIDRLITAINRVEGILNSQEMQRNDLITEESLYTTITGGNAMLNALRIQDRNTTRQGHQGTRVIFEWDLAKAFVEAHSALVMSDYEYAPSQAASQAAWTVTNLSQSGTGLERISDAKFKLGVGAMVGMSWIPHRGEPMLGFVRWIKEPKHGEQKMGVEFLHDQFKLVKGALLGGGGDELTEKRAWPILIKTEKKANVAFFPDARIFRNMAFAISHQGQSVHLKIDKVIKSGPNFTICHIVKAKELDTPAAASSDQLNFSPKNGLE